MRCEHILTKGSKKGELCGVYTNQTMDDGKYMCCTHRKNLKKYQTSKTEEKQGPVLSFPDAKEKNEVQNNETSIETQVLAEIETIEDELIDGVDEYYDNLKKSMLKVAPEEDVHRFIQKKKEEKSERAVVVKKKSKKASVLSDNFDDFRSQVEDCIAQLYDEILALKGRQSEVVEIEEPDVLDVQSTDDDEPDNDEPDDADDVDVDTSSYIGLGSLIP